MFEEVLQNYRYNVVSVNNVLFDFNIAEFPLMNLNDLITITISWEIWVNPKIKDKALYIIGYGHIKIFLDRYYAYLALIKIDLSTSANKKLKVLNALLEGKINTDDYEDGEIINQPVGVFFPMQE